VISLRTPSLPGVSFDSTGEYVVKLVIYIIEMRSEATRIALVAALTIALGGIRPLTGARQHQGMKPSSNSLQFGRDILLKDQPEVTFSEVGEAKLSHAIQSQVENYLAFYLRPEAQPRKDPQFTTRMFRASTQSQNDLVECRWTFSGVPLRAVQSLNAMKVDIVISEHANTEEVIALASSIVKLKGTDIEGREYEVPLEWPHTFANGVQFSSNPGADILALLSWHDRIDAFVDGNRLSVLIYKKIPQLAGYQDGSTWFEKYPPFKSLTK